jgi:hypothetical protein
MAPCPGSEVGADDVQSERSRRAVEDSVRELLGPFREVDPADHFELGICQQRAELLGRDQVALFGTVSRWCGEAKRLIRTRGQCALVTRMTLRSSGI